jgi:hypothetical protein
LFSLIAPLPSRFAPKPHPALPGLIAEGCEQVVNDPRGDLDL